MRGFTLVEILITITCATMLIGPILRLMDTGTKGVYKGSDRTYAVLAASDLIEAVRGVEFSVLPPREKAYSVDEIRALVEKQLKRNIYFYNKYEQKYAVGVFITEVKDERPSETNQKKLRWVTVKVMWESVLKSKEEISLSSFYSDIRAQ